ncbi:MAG: sulfide/dihydroorotate dehydrogenase-like FAD/NAD-binding protein [Clostridia bacterium]|nr:sulfide/dihydroorotate dehydrogenase-like FAD/NAD-binding protein [Clostridia bacterium]
MNKIIKQEKLAENLFLLEVEAPQLARKAKAGQFVIVRISEKGERIPLTIADYDLNAGTITLIFQVVGLTTKKMSLLKTGDYLLDLVGPLGEPSEIENYGTVACIGGGVGIAPIYPIARALKKAGNKVISIIGARNKDLLFWKDKMAEVSDELLIATDDGSEGHKGFVTDVLKEVMTKNSLERVWAIGPMIMMKNVAEVTRPEKIKTIVSLNPIMVDGTGMCGACRVSVGEETKFACVDGPEFDGHQVDFNLAMRRAAFYKDKEKLALEHYNCQCGGGSCKCQ